MIPEPFGTKRDSESKELTFHSPNLTPGRNLNKYKKEKDFEVRVFVTIPTRNSGTQVRVQELEI